MCSVAFHREQKAFWAQQSGSVRERLVTLETFSADVIEFPRPEDQTARLRSAIAFDHDQWGQVLTFDSIGEAGANWTPASEIFRQCGDRLRAASGTECTWCDRLPPIGARRRNPSLRGGMERGRSLCATTTRARGDLFR